MICGAFLRDGRCQGEMVESAVADGCVEFTCGSCGAKAASPVPRPRPNDEPIEQEERVEWWWQR